MREAVARTVPRYFNGPEPIGLALTGGLDTRLLMAWHQPQPRSLSCYTFGSAIRDTQDVVVARRIANECEQPHQIIPAGPEFLSHFSGYAERSLYLTDACIEVSRSADLHFSEQARRIAPVKVVGTYGSEVLTVIPTFKPDALQTGLFAPEFLRALNTAADTYASVRLDHPVTFAAFRQSPWWHYGVLALEQTQLSVRSPYLDNNFIRTSYRAPTGTARDVRCRLIADGNPRLAAVPTDRGVGGSRLLRTYQEFTLKAEYAYDSEMPQWLARADHALQRLRLERLFLGRHKPAHFRTWYRDALSGYVRDVLLDRRTLTRPYLKKAAVEAVVHSHVKGIRNHTRDIHKLLTLELMQRLFFD
jgi:asparagine synthase (glutamine-hydrolysing)